MSSAAAAPLVKASLAAWISEAILELDQTCVVEEVESLIVIEEPALSTAFLSSLIAATNDVFCVVVKADRSVAFPLTKVLTDLISVATLVATNL